MRKIGKILAALTVCLTSAACATADGDVAGQNDPFEQTNRAVFKFNMALDRNVAKPIAEAYVYVLPGVVRSSIHNVLANIGKPVTLGNDILQGEGTRAGQTLTRFVTNSTLGLGGILDVATMVGVPDHSEDFGQTLAVWGIGEGPYLMLPLLGPSNPRDAIGMAGDYFIDPLAYAHYDYENLSADLRVGFGVVDLRASTLDAIEQVKRTSLDFYATTRSLYRQSRKAEIRNGGFDDGDADPDAPPPDDF